MMLRSGSQVQSGHFQGETPLGGGDMEKASSISNQSPIRIGGGYATERSPSHNSDADDLRRENTQLRQELMARRKTYKSMLGESRSEAYLDPQQRCAFENTSAPEYNIAPMPHYAPYQTHNMSQSQHKPELFSEQRPIYGMQGMHAGLNNNQPIRNYQVGTDTHRHSRTINHHSDLQLKLPFFDGKGNWQGFWVQFELMSRHYRWNTDEQCDHLIMTLRDEALVYVSQLTPDIRHNLYMLVSAMKRRFDDPVLAETHRANLQCVSKKRNESVQEYATRINSITSKAYPGFQGTEMFQKIAIEHMLQGLDDPGVAYDVQTKRPKSMAEAVDMITWHECCRMNSRRCSNIRQLGTEISYCPEIRNTQYADEDSIRRITDERLAKFEEQFMQSMREGISQATSAQQDYDGAPKPAQQLHPEDYMAVNDENSQMMRHTDVIKTMDARSNIGNYTDSKVRTVHLDVNKTAIDTKQGHDEEA